MNTLMATLSACGERLATVGSPRLLARWPDGLLESAPAVARRPHPRCNSLVLAGHSALVAHCRCHMDRCSLESGSDTWTKCLVHVSDLILITFTTRVSC